MLASPWQKTTSVALFGTSADPPHVGHQSILTWLAQAFDVVTVWAAENPYKPKQSPLEDRAEMLRLLIETLPKTAHQRNNVELSQHLSDRYTIHSIERARRIWPNARFTFVVGADLVEQLPKWYKAKEIFEQVDILVFPRPGHPIQAAALSALQQQAKVALARPLRQHNIASSRYRQRDCDEVTHDLPSVVRDYIIEHDLYPCLQTPKVPPKTKLSTHR